MKTLKLLGIAALSALLVFGVTACPEPADTTLDGDLRVVASDYGPYTKKPLTAVYDGDEVANFTYQWFNGEEEINGAIDQTYIPTVAGTYSVVMSAEDYDPLESVNSIPITLAPDYIEFLGNWKTKTKFTPIGAPANSQHDEEFHITATSFRLDSSWDGSGYTGTGTQYGAKDDVDAPFEYLQFTISNWVELKDANLTVSGTTYKQAFKLTVDKSKTKTKGYTAADYTNFNLYMLNDATITIRRSGETSGSDLNLVQRDYVRQ